MNPLVKSNMFTSFSQELGDQYSAKPLYCPDAMEFVTSSEYANEEPTAFHRVALKTLYGLWLKYPPDEEEAALIRMLHNNWAIDIDVRTDHRKNSLILAIGRRGRKSALSVYIGSYEACRLITKYNPQKFYNIRERHTIHIIHSAASGDQAKEVFTLTKDLMRRSPFFRPYVDFDKDSETELRLFTPYDKMLNEQVALRNLSVVRGQQRESRLPGTIYVESITTSSRSSRGGSTICLLITEFAHMDRAKRTPQGEALTENPKSDYAVYTALKPSTKDFGDDFVEVLESSPQEKGGEFYHQYCVGGGPEQENRPAPELISPKKQVVQLSTWEANPTISEESLMDEQMSDPVGFEREYGGHFGNPSAQAIPEATVLRSIVPGRWSTRINTGRWKFTISLDPGGKAKVKIGDVYAIAWAHTEEKSGTDRKKYVVDGLQGFRETIEQPHDGGKPIIRTVDPHQVMQFLLELIRDLGGRNWINLICYDQFESSDPVAFLQSLGIPAMETTFSNPYKAKMYGAFLGLLGVGDIEMYEHDAENWVGVFLQEMKYLQRRTSGNVTFYAHPDTGPIQNDDFADVVANCVYQLHIAEKPTLQNLKEAARMGRGPVTLPTTITPQSGGALWGGSPVSSRGTLLSRQLAERMRRR